MPADDLGRKTYFVRMARPLRCKCWATKGQKNMRKSYTPFQLTSESNQTERNSTMAQEQELRERIAGEADPGDPILRDPIQTRPVPDLSDDDCLKLVMAVAENMPEDRARKFLQGLGVAPTKRLPGH